MIDHAPETPDELKAAITRIRQQLGPSALTTEERTKLETELGVYQKRLEEHNVSHARKLSGDEARNRGGDARQAEQEYDKNANAPEYDKNANAPDRNPPQAQDYSHGRAFTKGEPSQTQRQKCGVAHGELLTPCDLPKGHIGPHR